MKARGPPGSAVLPSIAGFAAMPEHSTVTCEVVELSSAELCDLSDGYATWMQVPI